METRVTYYLGYFDGRTNDSRLGKEIRTHLSNMSNETFQDYAREIVQLLDDEYVGKISTDTMLVGVESSLRPTREPSR